MRPSQEAHSALTPGFLTLGAVKLKSWTPCRAAQTDRAYLFLF